MNIYRYFLNVYKLKTISVLEILLICMDILSSTWYAY